MHAQRNKQNIQPLPTQRSRSTGQSGFGRGETVFLAVVVDNDRPTEQLGKITDSCRQTGAWLVNRYDDSCNSYFDHDLHKLITVGKPQEIAPTASVQIRRYTHEIRSWDNRTKTLGDVQGHVITERFVEHFAGKLKHPPHYYVVEIVYRGRTCYALNRNP